MRTQNGEPSTYNIPGFPYCMLVDKQGKIISNSIDELKDISKLIKRIEGLLN